MKKGFLVVGAALLLGTSQVSAWEGQVVISTPNTSLVLHANEGEDLRQDYYGGPSLRLINWKGQAAILISLPARFWYS